jgi:hypothetical protein
MNCIDRLRYNWFLWFGFKNKRKPTKHPMEHLAKRETSRIIMVDVTKLHGKKSKFEIVNAK